MTLLMHGTYRMYAHNKCRCDECRTYQNERVARNRAQRLATGNLNHGSRSSYDAGCRCTRCRKVRKQRYEQKESIRAKYRNHNHQTDEIEPYGMCAGCDDYWAGMEKE